MGGMEGKYTWLLETVESRSQVSRSIAIEGISRKGNVVAEWYDDWYEERVGFF